MKKIVVFAFCLCALSSAFAQDGRAGSVCVGTNLSYLALSALSINANSAMVAMPVDVQVALSDGLTLQPEAIYIHNWRRSGQASGTIVGQCGLAWHPEGLGLKGWYLGAGLGLAYATDSRSFLLLVNADGGYQWILGQGLFLGLGGGGRLMFSLAPGGGYLPMPDLKLRLGWALPR
jgi:hypothetical protein